MRVIVLSEHQLQAFGAQAFDGFVNKVAEHLRTCFPSLPEETGKDRLPSMVHFAMERGRPYGVVSERDVCLYIDLMVILGKTFDKDPAIPWAQRILANSSVPAGERLDRLLEMALIADEQRKPAW